MLIKIAIFALLLSGITFITVQEKMGDFGRIQSSTSEVLAAVSVLSFAVAVLAIGGAATRFIWSFYHCADKNNSTKKNTDKKSTENSGEF